MKPNATLPPLDINTLLANAPDTVEKDDEGDFNWDTATVSNSLDDLKRKLGRPMSGNPKQPISLRVDSDVLDYFRSQGKGWQTRMNNALREYMTTH